MSDNEKKIKLVLNEEKKELNIIPKSFQELNHIFKQMFNPNPNLRFDFYFIEQNDEKDEVYLDEGEAFLKQIEEIKNQKNPEIYAFQANDSELFDDHFSFNDAKSCESIHNNSMENENNSNNNNDNIGETEKSETFRIENSGSMKIKMENPYNKNNEDEEKKIFFKGDNEGESENINNRKEKSESILIKFENPYNKNSEDKKIYSNGDKESESGNLIYRTEKSDSIIINKIENPYKAKLKKDNDDTTNIKKSKTFEDNLIYL